MKRQNLVLHRRPGLDSDSILEFLSSRSQSRRQMAKGVTANANESLAVVPFDIQFLLFDTTDISDSVFSNGITSLMQMHFSNRHVGRRSSPNKINIHCHRISQHTSNGQMPIQLLPTRCAAHCSSSFECVWWFRYKAI